MTQKGQWAICCCFPSHPACLPPWLSLTRLCITKPPYALMDQSLPLWTPLFFQLYTPRLLCCSASRLTCNISPSPFLLSVLPEIKLADSLQCHKENQETTSLCRKWKVGRIWILLQRSRIANTHCDWLIDLLTDSFSDHDSHKSMHKTKTKKFQEWMKDSFFIEIHFTSQHTLKTDQEHSKIQHSNQF